MGLYPIYLFLFVSVAFCIKPSLFSEVKPSKEIDNRHALLACLL